MFFLRSLLAYFLTLHARCCPSFAHRFSVIEFFSAEIFHDFFFSAVVKLVQLRIDCFSNAAKTDFSFVRNLFS